MKVSLNVAALGTSLAALGALTAVALPHDMVEMGLLILASGILLSATASPYVNWAIISVAASANGIPITAGILHLRPEHIVLPLLLIFIFQCRWRASRRSIFPGIVVPGGLFIAWSLLVTSTASSPAPGYWIVIQYGIGILVLCSIRWAVTGSTMVDTARLASVSIASFGLISLASIITYILGHVSGATLAGVSPQSGRLLGLSFEPNIYAGQAAVSLGLAYHFWGKLGRTVRFLVVPITVGILLAGTRAAWIAVGVLGTYILLNTVRRKPRTALPLLLTGSVLAALAPAILAMLASSGLLVDDTVTRFYTIFDAEDGTGAYRLAGYAQALADLKSENSLLTGLGMNSFSYKHPIDLTGAAVGYISSLWVSLLYEVGVVGLILFALLLFAAVRTVKRVKASLLILIMISICAGFTNFMWFEFPWLALALLSVREQVQTSVNHQPVNPSIAMIRVPPTHSEVK